MPLFSLVIPTRNRPELANTALAHVLRQTWRDFEVVVLENSDQPTLAAWTQRDTRIRVVQAPGTLSMPDNWERGLNLVRGDYVLYLSDKDWLVPHAFDELAGLVRTRLRPAMVNIRKATWSADYGLSMQQGTGRVETLPSAPVLARWFNCVNHLHNAPMIYNSIVRRDLIDIVRERCGGRFFLGNSPDVASSLLLLANTPEYLLLDRIHVMAYFGPWSIGAATTTLGQQGAAARFAAEFGTDPIAAAGLPWGLTGVIAETLMACQRADPERFASYQINWTQYLERCWGEIAQRAARGQDTSGDMEILRAGVGHLYSWTTWVGTLLLLRLRRWTRWLRMRMRLRLRSRLRCLRDQTPLRILSTPWAKWWHRTGQLAPRPPASDPAMSFVDYECHRPTIAASTPEAAFALLLNDQLRGVSHKVADTSLAHCEA